MDTDILCLLARRLLNTNKHIRLVLMSATLAAGIYKTYFDVAQDAIHVGVRTFPIKEFFLEDIKGAINLPRGGNGAASELEVSEFCDRKVRISVRNFYSWLHLLLN